MCKTQVLPLLSPAAQGCPVNPAAKQNTASRRNMSYYLLSMYSSRRTKAIMLCPPGGFYGNSKTAKKDLQKAPDSVWVAFQEFVAPDYAKQGIEELRNFTAYNSIAERFDKLMARSSAVCNTFFPRPSRAIPSSSCIRQALQPVTTTSAPVPAMSASLCFKIL